VRTRTLIVAIDLDITFAFAVVVFTPPYSLKKLSRLLWKRMKRPHRDTGLPFAIAS
jgi:hypothetical protein